MSKDFIICAVTFLSLISNIAADPLKSWHFDTLDDIRIYAAKGNEASMRLDPGIKTPDGQKTLAVSLKKFAPGANAWDIQLLCIYKDGLKAGRVYEISFPYKGSVPGTVEMVAAQTTKPWGILRGATGSFPVTQEWKTAKLSFTAQKDWNDPLATPRMMLADYGIPAVLHFGPIVLKEQTKPLPFALNKNWNLFFGTLKSQDYATLPPKALKEVSLTGNSLNLAQFFKSFKEKDSAVLFNQFDSPETGVMHVGVSADWWLELYVNGKQIYSNIPAGNVSHSFVPDDHVIEIPVKKGRNLLAAKVIAGSNGWRFICGKPTRLPDDLTLFTISSGRNWKPLPMTKTGLDPKPGTALDLSTLAGERQPAGKYGRLIINANGRLAFEKKPEQPIRIRGFNSWTCSWAFRLVTKDEIKNWADSIARRGYNMIRLQGINFSLMGTFQNKSLWTQKEISEVPVIDPEALDKIDYLFSCLKENGIYFNIDLMSSKNGYSKTAVSPGNGFDAQLFFNPKYRAHWEAAARQLLNHRNPYTGLCWKDEPALACIEPYNEQDLLVYDSHLMKQFTPFFRRYLKNKYQTDDQLRKTWGQHDISFDRVPDINENILRRDDALGYDAGRFLIETMSATTDWYYERLRSFGYTGIITQWDMIMRTMEIPVRAKMPVIAQHSYFAHPNYIPTKKLVRKSFNSVFTGGKEKDFLIHQGSSINSSYFRAAAVIRFLDRPFMITEYSHSVPNRYRHERGLYYGAYAALQGWDAMYPHGDVVANWPSAWYNNNIPPLSSFENMQDPISYASEIITALIWFRGDVREAPHTVQLNLSDKVMFPKHFLAAIGDDYAKLAMLTRIGIAYPEVKPLDAVGKIKPDLELPLTEFSPLGVSQWYVTASNTDGKVFPELLQKLKDNRLLPPTNRTDYARRIYQSETGEITLNGNTETMTVITPRLEGAIIKKDVPVKMTQLEISSCSKPASIVVASLDKNQSLEHAKRLLLIFATNALNSDMVFENSSMSLMVEVGKLPVLMETAKLAMKLKSAQNTAPVVYALNMDGTRAESVPASFSNNSLSLVLDTSTLKYATPFFEIVFP